MNSRLLSRFLKVFISVFLAVLVVIGIGTYIAANVSKSKVAAPVKTDDFSNKSEVETSVDDALADKLLTTVALFGTAEDGMSSDVNLLIFFNHENYKIDVISVPKDTRVKIPDEVFEKIKSQRTDVEQIVRINEVPSLVSEEKNEVAVAVLEKSLGVDIDYYVSMNVEAFRKLVDLVGEVKVNIPFDMEYTDNNGQLFINLKSGESSLNGSQAEQLVRYKEGYENGELGRIKMQQDFLKSFVKELLSTKNRVNMINIITETLLFVDTDFNNITDYLVYLGKINEDSFRFHLLPGEVETTSREYYIYDLDKTKELFENIVAGREIIPEIIVDVKSLSISVQNGTNIRGLAGRTSEKLKNLGYNVEEITNYSDNGVSKTKIIVSSEEVFEELAPLFKEPEMVVNQQVDESGYDIIIVLGEKDDDGGAK